MSLPHHELPSDDRKLSTLARLFKDQSEGKAPRQWPNGRIGAEDDGEIAFKVGHDPVDGLVGLEFPKPVKFLAMTPHDAIELAKMLISRARMATKEPLTIVLH